MSPSMMLCEWCARIPLDPDVLNSILEYNAYPIYHLGSGARLGSSKCPFCHLVISAFFDGELDVDEFEDVQVMWARKASGRNAFCVLGAGTDIWICFGRTVADHQLEDTDIRRNYFIEPTTGPVLDTARVLRWISSCEQMHGSACGLPTHPTFTYAFRGLHLLRLIDVEADCLVEKRNHERYVALSYVWGSVSNFRLTKANRTALLVPGSLKNIFNLLPQTIRDTIGLVRRLGCRFVWVDALCLLQNDAEDLDRGVNAMDLIYELAWLTVVAGCGHDANASLPGVRTGTRRASRNTIEVKPGVEMGLATSMDALLRDSVYNSRAWTFQEMVLSRRILYFLDDQLFYRCRAAEHSEHSIDFLSQHAEIRANGSYLPEAVRMKLPEYNYSMMLSYYTRRALTNQNDAPRAMAGIIRRFSKAMKCRFFEGLPTALFDQYIIFHASSNMLHRRSAFPSYSWTGWRGSIGVDHGVHSGNGDFNNWLEKRTWIIWYKRSRSGVTNLVWDPSANDSFCSEDMTYSGYRDRTLFSDNRRMFKQVDTRRTMPTEKVSFSRAAPVYPLLQFWTLSVFYTITDIDVFEATGYLADVNDTKCGFVCLDGFEETTFFESMGPFEVILLSESCSDWHSHQLKTHSGRHYLEGVDQWPYYNVLLLEWQGGIAERRGIGIMFQGAVDKSLPPGPVWKEIFLA